MSFATVSLLTIAGGILPALVWLGFWLREDRKSPEPTRRIILTFLAGMAAAAVAIPISQYTCIFFVQESSCPKLDLIFDPTIFFIIMLAWAAIEEIVKFSASYIAALRSRAFDEPIDAPIYLITAALGFAALENTLFMLDPLLDGKIFQGLVTSNLRFIGATLLHVLTSSIVGITLAFVYYRSKLTRTLWTGVGICVAIALHTAFNYLIIESSSAEKFITFGLVWLAIIVILLLFERIKFLKKQHHDTT